MGQLSHGYDVSMLENIYVLENLIYISSYIVMCITKERTSLCVVYTCGLPQYKDAILPVYEFPL